MNPTDQRSNTRRSRRQAAKGSTRVRAYRNALGLGPNIGVRALDVSETGVRLVLKEALPVGQEFEVEIEGPAMKPFKAAATVRWTVKAEDGTFLVGASFDRSVGYAHLSALVR
ncbi:MAG: PilZ domain-containing protein [Gemmataceae bacterium]|nr:PilZ domain-containing protein [Gemmataceae bacterium]